MKKFIKNLLVKNKLKWLAILVPVSVLWLSFGLANVFGITILSWAFIPYVATSLLVIAVSIAFAITTIDKTYFR